jgi:signal transduction histidine kinase
MQKQRLQAEKMDRLEREQEIGQLKAIVKGEEKERSRVARELHDGIVGLMAAIRMNFSTVQHRHQLLEAEDFREALQQLTDASNEVRQTAYNLMPEALLQGGLIEAVAHHCRAMTENNPLDISFSSIGCLPPMDPDFELSAYRIIQELVQNIVRHSGATQAVVQLNYAENQLDISVEDNGKGIDQDILTSGKKGMGLLNLSRVKAFNGHIQLNSQEGNGARIYIVFDLKPKG